MTKEAENIMDEDFDQWDSAKMLDVYIHDYLSKSKLDISAKIFKTESKLPDQTPPIVETPKGFLYEWWLVYWDIFFAKQCNRPCSASSAAYIEALRTKARESQLQMQQSQIMLKHIEQLQQQDSNLSVPGGSLNAMNSEGMMSPPASSVSAPKMFEELMKHSNSMSSWACLTPSDFFRMGLHQSVRSHQGDLVSDHSGNASTSSQQLPSTMISNEGEVNTGATPMRFPKNRSIFEQSMLELEPLLRDAALQEAKTNLPLKGLPRAGIDQPTSSLSVQARIRDKNQILESDWQRVTAKAQAILNQKYKNVHSDRTKLQSGSPEVSMARAPHALSQQQQRLQQVNMVRAQHSLSQPQQQLQQVNMARAQHSLSQPQQQLQQVNMVRAKHSLSQPQEQLQQVNMAQTQHSLSQPQQQLQQVNMVQAKHSLSQPQEQLQQVNMVQAKHSLSQPQGQLQQVNMAQRQHSLSQTQQQLHQVNMVRAQHSLSQPQQQLQQVNMARAQHSLSQPQQQLQQVNMVRAKHSLSQPQEQLQQVNMAQTQHSLSQPQQQLQQVNMVQAKHSFSQPQEQLQQAKHSISQPQEQLQQVNMVQAKHSLSQPQGQLQQVNMAQTQHSLSQMQQQLHQVNMAQTQHSLSQPQQQLQQNDRKRKQSTFLGASTSTISGIRRSPSPISPSLLDTPESSIQQLCWMDGTNLLENAEWFKEVDTSGVNMEPLQSNDAKGFSFVELFCIRTSNSKITCCNISSDGKFLASAGHDKKVSIWNMEILQTESTPEYHKSVISDICFRPNSSAFVTSSFDNSVRLWDAANPKYYVRECGVHNSAIMSLDIHPKKTNLLCLANIENEIQYWDITKFSFIGSFKGGNAKVRFQPGEGLVLAAACDNEVSIFDVETSRPICSLQGHPEAVSYICWDANGETLASMSPNLVKIWSLKSGECVKEYNSSVQNQFHSCAFHPINSTMLVIGGNSFIDLWDMAVNKNMTMHAHEDEISALVHSPVTGVVASASYDGFVKLWK